jgi:2'-5' RNA ligase
MNGDPIGHREPGESGDPTESGDPIERPGAAAQPAEKPRRRRLFFALWPDEATRGAIARAARRPVRLSGGRPMAKRNLHITIAFLGALDEEGFERAAAVPPIATGAFELVLDLLGYWRESRVLWLAPSVVPTELTALERELWVGLEAQGFERERRIYRPHLTLARRARAVEGSIAPVRWQIAGLALVESVPLPRGVHYEPLREWPL